MATRPRTSTTALEAARAVNTLMTGDQNALLEVLDDYFTSPDGPERDEIDDDEDSEDDGVQEVLQGIQKLNTVKIYTLEYYIVTTIVQPPLADDVESDSSDDDDQRVVNVGKRVHEAMTGVRTISGEVTISSLPTDDSERELISGFVMSRCGCNKASGKPCSMQFSKEHLVSVRVPNLKYEHIQLPYFSKMRVDLATQVILLLHLL